MPNRPSFRLLALVLALFVAAITPRAGAQPSGDGPVKLRAVPQFDTIAPGGRLVIAIELDLGDEYHAWPEKSVAIPPDLDEFAIRTAVGFPTDDKGDPKPPPSWISALDGVQYPEAKPGKVPDVSGGSKPVTSPLYSHKAVAYARFHVAPNAPAGEQRLEIQVSYQACDENTCLMPEDVILPVAVRVAASGAGAQPKPNEPALFAKFDTAKWGSGGATKPPAVPVAPTSNPPVTLPTTAPSQPANTPAAGASLFGISLGTNLIALALAAALGGFVLNLTPCVLPIIPIKVMALTSHASSKRHALALGLWMALGVVAFWSAIGIPMAFISAGLDPSQFIFGIWWITLVIGLVIALMGLGIMGLFTLNLPQSVYMVEAKADSPFGSFLFGVMTAVLGLPCFGFVAGGLLAAAATLPATAIMVIFVGLGVGMAAPYLVLSVYPNLLKFIPRTGPASELVKQVMGILLLAAAAFFITAGIQALLKELPYLAGSMVWWAVGFFVALASIWMTIRTLQIARTHAARVVIPILAIAMTLGIVLFAQHEFRKDRAVYLARIDAMKQLGANPDPRNITAGVWLQYTPELLAALRAAGRSVFLDFTADWCITCKALKAAVLDGDSMLAEFTRRGVVLMEVDCTVRNSVGSKFLRELGRTGVPQWAIFGPGAEKPRFVTIETPTPATVIAELDAAGVPATATAASTPAPVVQSR